MRLHFGDDPLGQLLHASRASIQRYGSGARVTRHRPAAEALRTVGEGNDSRSEVGRDEMRRLGQHRPCRHKLAEVRAQEFLDAHVKAVALAHERNQRPGINRDAGSWHAAWTSDSGCDAPPRQRACA